MMRDSQSHQAGYMWATNRGFEISDLDHNNNVIVKECIKIYHAIFGDYNYE